MLVQPVSVPGSGSRSWTALGDGDVLVGPGERFLVYLTIRGPLDIHSQELRPRPQGFLGLPDHSGPALDRGAALGHR
jgi:hypothetical protein